MLGVKIPAVKLPWSVSFASFINAASIPLIAFLLWWLLDRTLDPDKWCPAAEEIKMSAAQEATIAARASLLCQPVILAQLSIAKFVATGLVGALALSHLVSVVREAKAGFELQTKFGNMKIGGDKQEAAEGAAKFVEQQTNEAAGAAVETVKAGGVPEPQWPVGEPKPTTKEGELP